MTDADKKTVHRILDGKTEAMLENTRKDMLKMIREEIRDSSGLVYGRYWCSNCGLLRPYFYRDQKYVAQPVCKCGVHMEFKEEI